MKGVLADTRPLADAHFRRLWTANIVTVVGAQLTVVAVPAQIYAQTGSSAYVGLTGVFGLVPLVVFGLWGGALADHFDRRTLLRVTTLGLIGTSALFWAQAATGLDNVWALLCLFAVQQAFFAINQPTRSAILPKLLSDDLLPAANSLNMTVLQAGAIAGPLAAGALIPFLGFSWLYLIDTICLFATLWAVLRLPPLPVEGASGRPPGLKSVIEGIAYLRGHPVLMMSFLVDIIAMVFGMPRALFPEIAHESFAGPSEGGLAFALLFAGIPAGAVIGGVFSGWVSRIEAQGKAVVWCIIVWGLAMTGFGVAVFVADSAPDAAVWMLTAAVVLLIVGGAADMASAAFRQSILQTSATDAVRGRLQGIFIVVVAGGPRIADVAHGAT
ncbi:MFS transporter, partial [Nocardioides stalactiti]|uniref:MFS transporter n=1 Tax=Nocardioides stalactiti TaxID=2755356 RepID=UPI0016029DD2